MLLALLACYRPPVVPPFTGVPMVAAPPEPCREEEDDAYVACSVDGDTFDLAACGDAGERVRMLGIDAPETDKPGAPAECYAQEAWDFLEDAITGQEVTVSFDRTCVDIYERTLAYVWIRGDLFEELFEEAPYSYYLSNWYLDSEEPAILLNEVMLGEGLVEQYSEEIAGTLIFQDRLDDAAAAAEQFSSGLWGACR